ncbi:unnamed protein product [Tilletia controversa]|nr:unnamed protein product [Tilletia controversa]
MPTANVNFIRPEFELPPGRGSYTHQGDIRTLYDLLQTSAVKNPDHIFCHQFLPGPQTKRTVSHSQLLGAVDGCVADLVRRGLARRSEKISDSEVVRGSPVALLLGSDISIFIYILALAKIGNPFILVSTRLSPEAVRHLLKATNARIVLTTENLWQTLVVGDDGEPTSTEYAASQSIVELLDAASENPAPAVEKGDEIDHNDCSVAIFHSSGSTGLPKPIYHCHRYLLGYAANHRLPATVCGMTNVSTLPLYHGFGLLAPCLSLSIGLAFALPHAAQVPTASSTLAMLDAVPAKIIFTVPSILEDILVQYGEVGLKRLAALEIVVSGGAPLKDGPGQRLIDAGVNVLNHFGATEFGAFAPICYAPDGYDWKFLLLRIDVPLRIEGTQLKQLTMRPFGWERDFVVQDELEVASTRDGQVQVRIKGRVDDVVVLATGEKVNPIVLENDLRQHPLVNEALVYGAGRFQAGVIIEVIDTVEVDEIPKFEDELWLAVDAANQKMDSHARVERPLVIVTSRKIKPLPRTVKGNPQRRESQDVFADEISAAFERLEKEQATSFPELSHADPAKLKDELRSLVRTYLPRIKKTVRSFADTEDFFELGMDSLRALRLTRALTPTHLAAKGSAPRPELIYANPTLDSLTAALSSNADVVRSAASAMRPAEFAQQAIDELRLRLKERPAPSVRSTIPNGNGNSSNGITVLLTGSTGSLGAHLVHALLTDKHQPPIARVICLNRPSGTGTSSKERQQAAFSQHSLVLDDPAWSRILIFEPSTSTSSDRLGLGQDAYDELVSSVDLIIHNAWPMDFHRPLSSFKTHLDTTARLIELSVDHWRATSRAMKVVFCSSIAVVARRRGQILEEVMSTDDCMAPMGYAEAKWCCETMLLRARDEVCPGALVPAVVRIGQLTGAEGSGTWSAQEHIAAIVRSSVVIGRLPELSGTLSWIPVNRAAKALIELALHSNPSTPILHLENPTRQSWAEMISILTSKLGLDPPTSWTEWLASVKSNGELPASKLVGFLEKDFEALGTGEVVLDTGVARGLSVTLNGSGAVGEGHVREYLGYWRRVGAL